jgi:hypothetical protein
MNVFRRLLPAAFVLPFASPVATAATTPAAAPAWSASAAAGARLGYDNNVFLQNNAPLAAPGNPTAPAHAGSVVTSLSAALGVKWQRADSVFDAGYAPELVRFASQSSENHDDHRITASLRGKNGEWSGVLGGSFLITEGTKTSPVFNRLGNAPAIGGEPVRARRAQAIAKVNGNLTRALGDAGFVRGVGALSVQDFHTHELPTTGPGGRPGYANYVDRSEWSAGVDAGWFARKDCALVGGIRAGAQGQADKLRMRDNYSNRLLRVLAGAEGKIGPALTFAFLAGPDFRHYGAAVAPGFDRTKSVPYAEGSATWTPRRADTIALSLKSYRWLSSGGRGAYQESVYDLQWRHALSKTWSTTAGINLHEGNNSDDLAPSTLGTLRHDWIYLASIGVACALNEKTRLEAGVSREWSDSLVADKQGRDYDCWRMSVGVKHTF